MMVSTKKSPPKAVGLWIRVSTEDQARGESPEHHEARGRAYAKAKDWHVVEVYRLHGVSGKAVTEHPEARRMLRDVERGHISGLIFSKLARLARSTKDLLDMADHFRNHGADLISLQESIDTSTPAGRLFYTVIAAMAQWEREEISDRVAASIPVRAKMGKSLGGLAPYGYQWKDNQLIPNPEEAPIRRLIHELFVETGGRFKTVATRLNQRGHRTRQGKLWAPSSIRRLIEDPSAKGLRRANYVKAVSGTRRWVPKPESEWIYSRIEPIISRELWDRCHQLMTERRAKRKSPSKRAVQLFGGLTWCACGQKMYVVSNSPKYVCQKCRNKIPIEDLEVIFFGQLRGFLLSPEDLRRQLERADEAIEALREQARVLEAERDRVQRSMDAVYRLYLEGQISPEGFGARHRPLEGRLGQLDEEIPRLQAQADHLAINLLSQDEALVQAQSLHDRWPQLDHQSKRQIVEQIVDRITIGTDDVTIDLYYLPTRDDPEDGPGDSGPDSDPPPSPPGGGRHPDGPTTKPKKSEHRVSSEIVVKGITNLGGCATPGEFRAARLRSLAQGILGFASELRPPPPGLA